MMSMRMLCLFGLLSFCGCAAQAVEIAYTAGEHPFPGPMSVQAKQELSPGKYTRVDKVKGRQVAGQMDRHGRIWWWESGVKPGQPISYQLSGQVSPDIVAGKHDVELKVGDRAVGVYIRGDHFTTLNYKANESKPYLYPVIGPTGDPVTRSYPMKEVEGERQDHHHHRSLWCAHGNVRLAGKDRVDNFWHEGKGHDLQKLKRIIRMSTGPVFSQIETEIDWVDSESGERDFVEYRTYTFFSANEDCRVIDIQNVFDFQDGDVTFGDDKEGGIIAIRVATSMDEKEPGKGMRHNSRGQSGDPTWGARAEWCDYVGPVNGKTIGIAVFDHADNYGHPSHWHFRDYGLYTANPFGLSHFDKKAGDGTKTWKKGEKAEFNYRVYIHKGDMEAGNVAGQYGLYANPPKIEIK